MADIGEAGGGQASVRGNVPSRAFPAAAEAKLGAIPDQGLANANKRLGFDASGRYAAVDPNTGQSLSQQDVRREIDARTRTFARTATSA